MASLSAEPSTGIKFPLKAGTGADELTIVGNGVKSKKVGFASFNISAMAFFVDAKAAAEKLAAFKSHDGAKLAKDEAFYTALRDATLRKMTMVCFARDVPGDQFASGLIEGLKPQMPASGHAALDQLTTVFKGRNLVTGTRVVYVFTPEDELNVAVMAPGSVPDPLPLPVENTVTIKSAELVKVMMAQYFGKDPASPALKESVAKHIGVAL